jgi:YidC/Oxa1 family membrane protein insertase
LLFSCTIKSSTRVTSPLISPTSIHFRTFSSKPTPTSSTQPVYSQTDDTLTGTARETTPTTAQDLSTQHDLASSINTDVTTGAADVATEVVTKTGEAISWFPPVNILADLLMWVHHSTGMPWWATIIAATTTVRVCMFPLMAHVMRNNLKLAALKVFCSFLSQTSSRRSA